jgi:hypothetical protein
MPEKILLLIWPIHKLQKLDAMHSHYSFTILCKITKFTSKETVKFTQVSVFTVFCITVKSLFYCCEISILD